MRRTHDTPTDLARLPAWAEFLADALGLSDYSAAAPKTALARCLLLAAAFGTAVSAVCRRAAKIGRELARRGLAAAVPNDPTVLENRLARGLHRGLGRSWLGRRVSIAIDTHRRPYYGNHDATPAVSGGKADRGTRWAFAYATAVVLSGSRRHTLALTAVRRHDTPGAIVERVLRQVGWSGVRVREVLLDRAFYAVGVINALRQRGLRFVIPVVRRGQAKGRFFRRGSRGWFVHTVRSRRRCEGVAQVPVAVIPGADGRRPLVFACSEESLALTRVALRYARRFGIESSYRQLGECLARTSSRDAGYRLMLVGVSLLLREWWVVGSVRLSSLRLALILSLCAKDAQPHPNPTQPKDTTTPTPTG